MEQSLHKRNQEFLSQSVTINQSPAVQERVPLSLLPFPHYETSIKASLRN